MSILTASLDQQLVLSAMVNAAVAAPSPDNNQPWRFRATDKGLSIFLDKSRSLPSDVMSMFDMTAIGAATENAVIAAAEHGMVTKVEWTANDRLEDEESQPIAELQLFPGGTQDPLFSFINARCTCRKLYSPKPLPTDVINQLDASLSCFPGVQIDWIYRTEEKRKLGKFVAMTDSLRFQHRPFHEELFRQLRFHRSEVESSQDGLDVRTLELPFGATTVLSFLRSWNVMNVVHRLRMTSLLTVPSAVSIQKSGAIAIISVPTSTAEAFFTGGRAIQRMWLAGTKLGLSMHPLGSLPIFLLQPDPPPAFRQKIESVRHGVHGLMPELGDRVIQLGMRVGFSNPPSERSRRRNPDDMIFN